MASMRRFSQRNPLVTLDNINITPLLDLAFVLLIIFVIATQTMEQGMSLELPSGGSPDQPGIEREDIQTVEIGRSGEFMLNSERISLQQMETLLVREFRNNPNMVVNIRGDRQSFLEYLAQVLDICTRNNITRFSLRTEPE